MNRCKILRFVLIIITVCFAICMLYINNSLVIELKIKKFYIPDVIYCGIDSNGDEYKVIKDDDMDNMKVGIFTKSKLGLWKATELKKIASPETKIVNLSWMVAQGVSRFEFEEDPRFEFELHSVYYGNNAIKNLEGLYEKLPSNVTMSIEQSGSIYLLHFMAYDEDVDILSSLNIVEMLTEGKYIQ